MKILVFCLDDRLYGLAIDDVERVIRAVEPTPLPGAPPYVLGAINVHGLVLPVLSLRRRLTLPDREIHPGDQFLIALTPNRRLALVIDGSERVVDCDASVITGGSSINSGLQRLQGVATIDDDLLLIPDLEAFFSLEEELALEHSLERLQ